jgi:hypothetical protein
MSRLSDLPPDVLEMLSAALDGALDPKEQARLQARLRDDERLRLALQELREVRAGLGGLPRLRVPRNFTLNAEMAGRRASRPAYPRLRLATALAALAFVLAFGLDTFALRFAALPAARQALAPAPVGEIAAEAPPQPAAEMMMESGALAQATPAPSELRAEAERSAADSLATATALPTVGFAAKAGEADREVTPEAPVEAPPAAPQASAAETEAPDQVLADAIEPASEEQARVLESRWAARPLQLIAIVLGLLTMVLGVVTIRARRPA